jgi:hypothetical protein
MRNKKATGDDALFHSQIIPCRMTAGANVSTFLKILNWITKQKFPAREARGNGTNVHIASHSSLRQGNPGPRDSSAMTLTARCVNSSARSRIYVHLNHPPETGIGGVGNKIVTSKLALRTSDWMERHVFPANNNRCQQRRQPNFGPKPITGRLLQIVRNMYRTRFQFELQAIGG